MEISSTSTTKHDPALAALTSLEMQRIVQDVYGARHSSFDTTSEGVARGQQAIDSLCQEVDNILANVAITDKAAYLEAKTIVPHLVKQESSVPRFLQFDAYDPRAAANRLALYWERRKHYFGKRAFLPMIHTGQGALSPSDIKLLSAGFVMLLPPDRSGRAVLLHDRSRLTSLDTNERLRCLFYLLHVASETEFAPNGLVLLTVYSDKTRASAFDASSATQLIRLLQCSAVPVRIKACHLVMLTSRPVLEDVAPTSLALLQQQWPYLRQRTIVHPKQPLPILLEELNTKYGLHSDCLPKVPLGGQWTIEHFKRWRDDRLYYELKQFGKSKKESCTESLLAMSQSTVPIDSGRNAFPDGHGIIDMKDKEEQHRNRRSVDAMYARRQRVRRNIEFEGMQEQLQRLRQQRLKLLNHHSFLEDMLRQAKQLIQGQEKQVENNEYFGAHDVPRWQHTSENEHNVEKNFSYIPGADQNVSSSFDLKKTKDLITPLLSTSTFAFNVGKLGANPNSETSNSGNEPHKFQHNPVLPLLQDAQTVSSENSITKAKLNPSHVVENQTRTERQLALVQSWYERYACHQLKVAMYMQRLREQSQTEVALSALTSWEAQPPVPVPAQNHALVERNNPLKEMWRAWSQKIQHAQTQQHNNKLFKGEEEQL